MISPNTISVLADAYKAEFHEFRFAQGIPGQVKTYPFLQVEELHDFFSLMNYPSWFCKTVREWPKEYPEVLKIYFTDLYTGEAIPYKSAESKERQGQQFLHKLAEDMLNLLSGRLSLLQQKLEAANKEKSQSKGFSKFFSGFNRSGAVKAGIDEYEKKLEGLTRALELDGYVYQNHKLIQPESEALDINEDTGVLKSLYLALSLPNKEATFHGLEISEKNYLAGNWEDCAAAAREFFESVLRDVACEHSLRFLGKPLPEDGAQSPGQIRDYLVQERLITLEEKETIAKIDGLLSGVGSQPYIAESDQVRLLRNLALTMSQLILLRFEGYTEKKAGGM